MYTRKFWTAAGERAVKTLAQTAVALLAGDGVGLLDVDWLRIGSVAGLAAVLSLLTSIGSAQVRDDTPSLAGER
jgi:hypothetical protein